MIVIYVVCKPRSKSMRDAIVNDRALSDYRLRLVRQKKPGRKPGWAQLVSDEGYHGGIRIEWHGDTKVMVCRVVTRGAGNPSSIIGDFFWYLFDKHHGRIQAINSV